MFRKQSFSEIKTQKFVFSERSSTTLPCLQCKYPDTFVEDHVFLKTRQTKWQRVIRVIFLPNKANNRIN